MFCNYCGAPNPTDAVFCSACGKAITQKPSLQETLDQPGGPRLPQDSPTATEDTQTDSAPAKSETRYKGVRGWLAFFILSLTVFSPILTVVILARELYESGFAPITILDGVISLALTGFGIFAGIRLWKIKPNAVRTAKRYLLAYLIYLVAVLMVVIFGSLWGQRDAKSISETIGTVGRSVFYVIIWYSYLEKSRRVAATYAASGTPATEAPGVDAPLTALTVAPPDEAPKPKISTIWNKLFAYGKLRKVQVTLGLAILGFGLWYNFSNREFVVTGKILYKPQTETRVQPVGGASISVYANNSRDYRPERKYERIILRQLLLKIGQSDANLDAELAPLGFQPLAEMDRIARASATLSNCRQAAFAFPETLGNATTVAHTSTDSDGSFWLKLKRGKYFIVAESEVPSSVTYYEGDPGPRTGSAFWEIPVTVTGEMKVVSADAACSPD